jgi:hypothetical protein
MSTFRSRLVPAFLLLFALLGEADGSRPAGEYKFDSPSVLFLGTNRPNTSHPQSRPVRYEILSRDAALAILSASDHDWDSPEVMSYGANTEKERALIAGEKQRVRRSGKRLTITPASGSPITFTNWSDPGGPQREGDGAKYFYAGRFGRLKYYRVEDRLEHDSPGSYLINPANGNTAYTHHGDDIAALSPDNVHLLVFNPLNLQEHRALTVASLSADGPTVELRCVFKGRNSYDVSISFKGWRNPSSFDIVFNSKDPSVEPIPVHIEQMQEGYVVAVPDRLRLENEFGFMCGH